MFFLQALQAPVIATIVRNKDDRTVLSIPKLLLEGIEQWMAEYHAQKLAEQLEELDEARRREFITFYRPIEPDINEIAKIVRTTAGTRRVLEICLPLASHVSGTEFDFKSPEGIAAIIKENGLSRLFPLAWALADLTDQSAVDPDPPKLPGEGDDDDKKDGADPLTGGGKST